MKRIHTTALALLAIGQTMAQAPATAKDPIPAIVSDPMTYIVVITMAILLATVLVLVNVVRRLVYSIAGPSPIVAKPEVNIPAKNEKPSVFSRLNTWLSDSVPVEKEADVLLDHNYDGIKELDNNLPPWWKYGFYITILFAFLYMAHYHVVGSGNVQVDEYNKQLADAEIAKQEYLKMTAAQVDENTAAFLAEASDLGEGKKIFMDKCKVCHGAGGEGSVGPNLTDDYWIHGGDIKDVFKLVKYGFPSKGMLAWQGQLSPVQIQQVSSFVKSLHGTNPANPKAPQGELYKENISNGATVDSTQTDSMSVENPSTHTATL